MTQSSTTPPLMVRDVSKLFGAVAAMHGVSFPLHAGEVHALVGENGAGKSTIVKVLAGANRPDSFQIEPDGQPVELHNPADAKAAGIAVIWPGAHALRGSVRGGNIAMGRQPLARFGAIDRAEENREAARLFTRLGVSIEPTRPARGLLIADQQIVEIAKALSSEARIIVMDEPTTALSGVEVDRLFAVARSLRDRGVALFPVRSEYPRRPAISRPGRDGGPGRRRPMTGRDDQVLHRHRRPTTGESFLLRDEVFRLEDQLPQHRAAPAPEREK